MDGSDLRRLLSDLPLGALRYYDRIGSTNDEAAQWARNGAPDLSLVVADEQTAGRGRRQRDWFTPPGAALAFSLVLRPTQPKQPAGIVARFTALGALAVVDALRQHYDLDPQLKWPNDVLLRGRKIAGVLAEACWQGDSLETVVLGIGVNVLPASVPPPNQLVYPATCVASVLGKPLDRLELLHAILVQVLDWRSHLDTQDFLEAWQAHLAFLGEWVGVYPAGDRELPVQEGQVLGLDPEGRLRLLGRSGQVFTVSTGDVRVLSKPL